MIDIVLKTDTDKVNFREQQKKIVFKLLCMALGVYQASSHGLLLRISLINIP